MCSGVCSSQPHSHCVVSPSPFFLLIFRPLSSLWMVKTITIRGIHVVPNLTLLGTWNNTNTSNNINGNFMGRMISSNYMLVDTTTITTTTTTTANWGRNSSVGRSPDSWDRKNARSIPGRSGRRIFFPESSLPVLTLIRYPSQPRGTAVALYKILFILSKV